MTDFDPLADAASNYATAIRALRMRVILSGEALPGPDERIDLLLMAAIARQIAEPAHIAAVRNIEGGCWR